MASFSGYIRLQDGSDQLFWNEIDNQGSVNDINQFLGWNDWTAFQMIFYVNPPAIPITPPPSSEGSGDVIIKRTSYYQSDRHRVFHSIRERVFLS